MVEILAKFSIAVDWNNYREWENWNDSNFQFANNERNITTLFFNGWSTQKISKDFLEKYTDYRIKLKISDYFNAGVSGGLYIKVGDNTQTYNSLTTAQDIEFIINSGNGTVFSLQPYSLNTRLGISNIIIEKVEYDSLDVYSETYVPLNFKIADVNSLDQRSGNYSKDFSLPGTEFNNKFFKYIFEINNENVFNKNKQLNVKIINSKNKAEVVSGVLKLNEIEKNDNEIVYKVNYFSKVVGLFDKFKDDVIADLDFSDLNHYATYQNIINTWINYHTLGYVYPYIDLGNGELTGVVGRASDDNGVGLLVDDLFPAITASKIFEKIEEKYNVSFTSSLFNQIEYNRIIVPYQNPKDAINNWTIVARLENQDANKVVMVYGETLHSFYLDDISNGKFALDTEIEHYRSGIPKTNHYLYPNRDIVFLETKNTYLNINNNTGTGGASNSNLYSAINYEYDIYNNLVKKAQYDDNVLPGAFKVFESGKYKLKIKYKLTDFTYTSTSYLRLFAFRLNSYGVEYPVNDESNGANNTFKVLSDDAEITYYVTQHTVDTGGWVEKEFTIDAEKDDMINFKFALHTDGYVSNGKIYVDYIEIQSYTHTVDTWTLGNNFAPKNYKVSDFVKDFLILTNSVIDEKKGSPNEIIIENRITYNGSGDSYDWTKKLDKGQPINIKPLNKLQSKSTKLKLQMPNDKGTKNWEESCDVFKVGYGGKEFIFDSDFIEGEAKEIKPSILPTKLTNSFDLAGDNNYPHFVYSTINQNSSDDNYEVNTEIGNRLLYFNYLDIYDNAGTASTITFRFVGSTYHGQSTYKYPYAGHFSNPFDMTSSYDLNFETPIADYFSNTWQFPIYAIPAYTSTNLNMYNQFWKKWLLQMADKDSWLVECYLNINDNDISDFSFNNIYQIDGTNYVVNEIKDYIPGVNSLFKVELIKMNSVKVEYDDYDKFTNDDIKPNPQNSKTIKDKKNTVGLGDAIIIQDSNTIINSAQSTPPSGSSTVVINSNNVIFGSDTKNNTIINDKNIKVGESGSTYISGVIIKNGYIIEGNNALNDCGADCIQVPFSNAGLIDSGENNIYQPDWIDSDTVIEGGKN